MQSVESVSSPPSTSAPYPLFEGLSPALESALKAARPVAGETPERRRVVVVQTCKNTLEVNAFALEFMKQLHIKSLGWSLKVHKGRPVFPPSPETEAEKPECSGVVFDEDRSDLDHRFGLIFTHGELIKPMIQYQLMQGNLRAVDQTLIFLNVDASAIVIEDTAPRPQPLSDDDLSDEILGSNRSTSRCWRPEFLEFVGDIITLPEWKDRPDQERIIRELHSRLPTRGRPLPHLDHCAVEYFRSNPFKCKGTDDVRKVMEDGFKYYLANGESGPLKARHFCGLPSTPPPASERKRSVSPLPFAE